MATDNVTPPDLPPEELRRRFAHNLERLMKARKMDEHALAEALTWTKPTTAHGASNIRNHYLTGDRWPMEKLLLEFCRALAADPMEFVRPIPKPRRPTKP